MRHPLFGHKKGLLAQLKKRSTSVDFHKGTYHRASPKLMLEDTQLNKRLPAVTCKALEGNKLASLEAALWFETTTKPPTESALYSVELLA